MRSVAPRGHAIVEPTLESASELLYSQGLRYAKSVVYLPWNFHKLFRSYGEIQQVIRDTAARQGRVEGLLLDLGANQAALQVSVNQLSREVMLSSPPVARIVEALEDISGYLEPYSNEAESSVFLPLIRELDRAA